MNHLQKFLQKRSIADGFILAAYKDFSKFVREENLPKFKINYVDSRLNKEISYKANVELFGSVIQLNINIAYYSYGSEFKNILVHEFTHIYDYYKLSNYAGEEFLRKNMQLYTEYHAYQFETLYAYHVVSNIYESIPENISTDKSIANIPAKQAGHYLEKCKLFYSCKTAKNFNDVQVAYMYYRGAENLFSIMVNKTGKSINFIRTYDDLMQQIIKILSGVDYKSTISIEQLTEISDIRKQIDQIYLSSIASTSNN